ncbi:hypothetical protein MMC18_007815 [Xylographa bjoerkii]|nr:hypothetical protein [Xylographa bjoerkii]
MRAWAREQDYVFPGQDGTISMGAGSVFGNFGGGPIRLPRMGETERPLDERLGLVPAGGGAWGVGKEGEKGGEVGGGEGKVGKGGNVMGREQGGLQVGQEKEKKKKKRGSFERLFHRGGAGGEGKAEEDMVR